jgi:hypothetical protein
MTATTNDAAIPPCEHLTGFTAVAVTFPAEPGAHRVTRVYDRPDGTEMGAPTKFDGSTPFSGEIRPACRADSDLTERFYELSIPMALHRGAAPCDHPDCYGGDR